MNISDIFKNAKDFLEEYGDIDEVKEMAKELIKLFKILSKGKKEKAFKTISKWKDVAETIQLAEEIRLEGYKQLLAQRLTEFLGHVLKIVSVMVK